jgi:hypothetical protein
MGVRRLAGRPGVGDLASSFFDKGSLLLGQLGGLSKILGLDFGEQGSHVDIRLFHLLFHKAG